VSCPEDVSAEAWEAAEAAWEALTHVPIDRDAETVVIARAITAAVAAEREACAQAVASANLWLGNIETPQMRGDNLAVTLCTHFDDGEPTDDDTGWSPAAIGGYEEVIAAIAGHYTSAIRARSTPC